MIRKDCDICSLCRGQKYKVSKHCRKCSYEFSKTLWKNRFLGYIKKSKGCWKWTASINNVWGYGQFSHNGKWYRAHRIAYELFKGSIPKGMNVCHSCDNRSCVNPKHLWLGTQKENLNDAKNKKRTCKGEKNAMARLSRKDVRKIRRFLKKGLFQREIAELMGISQKHVSDISLGRRWGWL